MSSPHSTDACRPGWLLVAALLVLGGCAAGPEPAGTSRTPAANAAPGAVREVPAAAQTLYEQAVAAMAAGDEVDAELRLQAFLLEYPDYPGAYVNLAIIFAGRGDLTAAENSLTDALILDPRHAPALNQLGMVLRRQGRFEDAESAYMKAVTAAPDYALAHYNLGVLNDLYLQRLDIALTHYERYQELTGEDPQVTKWIADLKRRLGTEPRAANVTE